MVCRGEGGGGPTVQSIYANMTAFRFFFFMISASGVTCCMFINTADFLYQCIVQALYTLSFCCFRFLLGRGGGAAG